ncbi:glycosyl hydrolase family protein [Actinomyces bowdenii]|uniref:Glycosyl hydrolase family protein n=1 Tax=Actinomyces bowdenii TaxID=131109 RepID=A0A3P1V8C6_9ACTO|nr:glycosyl hydrolase family protein [Actinomyces bowdenii]
MAPRAPSTSPAPSSPSAPGDQSASGAPGAPQEPSTSPAPDSGAGHDQSQAQIEGWSIDFFDGFDTPLEQTKWERYGWGDPPVGHGAMGVMSQRNSFTRNGSLVIRTQYENGQWSAGGAGSKFVHTASYGRWEVRARFPQAKGIGYAFLLWPADEGWPPEIDFAEGRVNGPQVMGVYHWDPDNKQEHRFMDHHDMSGWHTYGVIVEPDRITFTLDGQPWGTIEHPSVTDKQMFIGFQTGAMDPNGWQSSTETVDGGAPGPLTPAVSDIEIDYVAHYTRN